MLTFGIYVIKKIVITISINIRHKNTNFNGNISQIIKLNQKLTWKMNMQNREIIIYKQINPRNAYITLTK